MKKIQTTSTLKVSKALVPNHNQVVLKVRKALNSNHNQTTLKERWLSFVYTNCQGLSMNHNQTALKVCK